MKSMLFLKLDDWFLSPDGLVRLDAMAHFPGKSVGSYLRQDGTRGLHPISGVKPEILKKKLIRRAKSK